MAETSRSSVAQLQRRTSLTKSSRSSITKDAEEFKERNQDGWQDSSGVKNCSLCKSKFTMTKRKHHCRDCGNVFCGKCSSYKTVINGELKRSCLSCYKKAVHKDVSSSLVITNPELSAVAQKAASGKKEADSMTVRNSDVSADDGELPSWGEALVFIRKVGNDQSQVIQSTFPEDALTREILEDVISTAMPRPLRGSKVHELKFMFRVRDKQLPGPAVKDIYNETVGTAITKTTVFYNCYVFYRQQLIYDVDAGNGQTQLMRQAVVLISKWPFAQLAFRILEKVDEAFYWNAETTRASVVGGKGEAEWKDFDTEFKEDEGPLSMSPAPSAAAAVAVGGGGLGWEVSPEEVNNVLMVAFGQIAVWPTPSPAAISYMHFFGEMLQYSVPADILTTYGANLSFSSTFSSINLVSLFGPLGLLQHVWSLWELVVSGQDIVVVASTPTQASEIVLAIASLMLPLTRIADMRPYMQESDSDILVIAAASESKQRMQAESAKLGEDIRSKSMVVGVTDLGALRCLESFGAALFVAPHSGVLDSDAVFKGLRTKNAAAFVQYDSATGAKKAKGKKASNSYVDYCNSWADSGSLKSALVCRQELTAFTIKKLLVKIKQMAPKDRAVLGDKLLRDNLKELTMSFFKPVTTAGTTLESSDVKESTIERAQLAEERIRITQEANLNKNMSLFAVEDVTDWFRNLPEWVEDNVPTILLWVLYVLGFVVLKLFGIPPVVLVGGALVVRFPDKAPRNFELLLRNFFPMWFLYPGLARNAKRSQERAAREASTASAAAAASAGAEEVQAVQKVDLSGVWKRTRLVNYEALLAAQGAGLVQRKMAASMSVVHTITMSKDLTVLRLQEKGGPIDVDNTYIIDGPEVTTNTMKNIFLDKATWEGSNLRLRKLRMPEQAYELVMTRELEADGKVIKLQATYHDLKKKGTDVVADCYFEYVGPTPNDSPPSANGDADAPAAAPAGSGGAVAAPAKSKQKKVDYSGVWNRSKTVNFEAFVGAAGAPFLQRKLAATMALVHTITMDAGLYAFRLQEKGGPIDTDTTLTIGGDYTAGDLNGKKFKQRTYWESDGSLVLQRVFEDKNYELVLTRTLEDDGDKAQIVLKCVHRDLTTGKETEATSWFTKLGPSKSAPPVPDMSKVPAGDGAMAAAAEDEDMDNDEDDDEVAVAKMRTISTVKMSQARSKSLLADLSAAGNIEGKPLFNPSVDRTKSVSSKPNFTGTWVRSNEGTVDRKLAAKMALTHVIVMEGASLRLREVAANRVTEDLSLQINGDFVNSTYNQKPFRSRCYFEGETLVVNRFNDSDSLEFVVRRDLEENGTVIRLTSTQKNLTTGEESESMMIFNLESNGKSASPKGKK